MQMVTEGSMLPAVQVCATESPPKLKRIARTEKTNKRLDIGAPFRWMTVVAGTWMQNRKYRFAGLSVVWSGGALSP
jgi:hypothetical protein